MPVEPLAAIQRARYFPELLPFSYASNIGAGATLAPPLQIAAMREQLPNRFLRLTQIRTMQNVSVRVDARADGESYQMNAAALPFQEPPAELDRLATTFLSITLANIGALAVAGFPWSFAVWVIRPSIAEKLSFLGPRVSEAISLLSPEEKALALKRCIDQAVKKGTLPIPLSPMPLSGGIPASALLAREYIIVGEEPFATILPIVPAGPATSVPIVRITPRDGEAIVLTGLAADTPAAAINNTRFLIDRDNDVNYLELPTWTMTPFWDQKAWVPATREIAVRMASDSGEASYGVRVTWARIKLTDLLQRRWGLIGPEEMPELTEVVAAGVV